MSEREEHDKLADDLEQDADKLQEQSEDLEQEIGDVRQDWEAKRREHDPDADNDAPSDTDE